MQQDLFHPLASTFNTTAAVAVPHSAFFELYPIILELAEQKAKELELPLEFGPTQYCQMMQHCWNAKILEDYPYTLDDQLAEYLEGIMINYDIIHLDVFAEETLKLFPDGRKHVELVQIVDQQSFWKVRL